MSEQYFAVHDGTLYLEHHGIKGQRWGVRRFQNKNGSLTAAGRKRLGYSAKSVGKAVVAGGKKVFNTGVSVGKKAAGAVKEHNQKVKDKKLADKKEKVSKTREGVLKNKKLFSNQELKDLEARFKVEDELRAGKLNQGIATAKAISQYADTALKIANAAHTGGEAIKAISEGVDSMNFKKKAESKGLTAAEYRSAIDKGYLADKLTREANAEGSVGGKKAKAGNKSSTDADNTKKKPDDGGDKPKKPSDNNKPPDNDKPKPEAPKEDKKDFTPEGARKAFNERALKNEADTKAAYENAKKKYDDNKAALDKATKDSDDNFVRMATSKSEAEYDVAKAKKIAADKKVSELSEPTRASEAEAKKTKDAYDKASENASVAKKQASAKSIADDAAKMIVDRDLEKTGFYAAKNNRTSESDRKTAVSYIANKLSPKKALNGTIDKIAKKVSDKAYAEDEKKVKKEAEQQTKELSKRIEEGIRTGKTDVRSSIENFYRTSYNLSGEDLRIAVNHFMDGHAYSAFMGDYGTLYLQHFGVKGMKWGSHKMAGKGGKPDNAGGGGGGNPFGIDEEAFYEATGGSPFGFKEQREEYLKKAKEAEDTAKYLHKESERYAREGDRKMSRHFRSEAYKKEHEAESYKRKAESNGNPIKETAYAIRDTVNTIKNAPSQVFKPKNKKRVKHYIDESGTLYLAHRGDMNEMAYHIEDGTLCLAHYGLKGQKWGQRRFQNPDGSLTAAGKARYGKAVETTGGGGGGAPEEEDEETKKKIEEAAKKAGMTVEAYRKKFADKVAEIKKSVDVGKRNKAAEMATTNVQADSKNIKQDKRKADLLARSYKRTVGYLENVAVRAGKDAESARKQVDALKNQREKTDQRDQDRVNEAIDRAGKRLSRNAYFSEQAQNEAYFARKKYVDRVDSMVKTAKSKRQKSEVNAKNAEATARRKAELKSQKGVKSTLARGKESITGFKQKHKAKNSDKKYNNNLAKLTTEFADSPNGAKVLAQLNGTKKRKPGKKPVGSASRPVARKKKVSQQKPGSIVVRERYVRKKPNGTVAASSNNRSKNRKGKIVLTSNKKKRVG